MVPLSALAQQKRTPGEEVLFPDRPVQVLLLAVVDVGPALGGGPAGGRLGAPLEGGGEQLQEGGVPEARFARGGIGEDRQELVLAQSGGVAAEQSRRRSLGGRQAVL